MIKAVVMAGGSGTRLWPLSRAVHPKQFLALHGKDSMLQATFKRLHGLDIQSSVTICNEEHRFCVAEQLREIDKLGSIISKPDGAPRKCIDDSRLSNMGWHNKVNLQQGLETTYEWYLGRQKQ